MAIIGDTYLTSKGFEIANKSANGQSSFTLTRAVSSPEQTSTNPDEIKKLNNLNNEMNTGQIINTDVKSSNLTGITVNFLNDIYTGGYDIGSIGIYAKEDGSDNEFMYSVTPFITKQQIPELNNNVFSGYEVTIYLIAGDSQRMNVNLSKGGDASIDLVEKLISNSESETQKKLDNKANISYVDDSRDKAIQQSSQYTDNKYNDLQNKNNILSNDLKSNINTTNNLADKYSRSYYDAPNLSGTTNASYSGYGWIKVLDFQVEEGKKYWISAYSDEKDNWDLETVYDNSQSKMTNTNFFSRSFIADSTKKLPVVPYNDSGNGGNLYNICITQSDSYVPFEIAQRNKLWNDRITNKTNDKINSTKPHNLAPYYETSWDTWFTTHWGDPNSQVPVEKGKTYWFSCYVGNGKVNISSSEGPNSQDASKTFALQPDYYTGNYYANWGQYFICKWVSDRNGNLPLSFNSPNQNEHRRVTKICVTQSENYIPYEETDSDTSVNELAPIDYVDNQLSNKTDNLSSRIDDTNKQLNDTINNKINNGVNKSIQQSNENITKVSNNKVTDNHDGTIQINGKNQSISKGINKCDLNNITTPGTYFSSGIDDIQDYINTPTIYNKTSAVNNMYFVLTVYKATNICLTQVIKSGDFKPYYRNHASDGWSQWYQLADTDYVDNQIASIKANAWRELKFTGNKTNGKMFCKANLQNNTATLVGMMTVSYDDKDSTIISPTDFSFNSTPKMYNASMNSDTSSEVSIQNGNILLNTFGQFTTGELTSGSNTAYEATVSITPK